MAIFSTHLLNAIDGTHADNVEIIIYKSNNNNKVIFLYNLPKFCNGDENTFSITPLLAL